MASRHESARECWLQKEKVQEEELKVMQEEKEGVASELNTLSAQLKDLNTDLEAQRTVNANKSNQVDFNLLQTSDN